MHRLLSRRTWIDGGDCLSRSSCHSTEETPPFFSFRAYSQHAYFTTFSSSLHPLSHTSLLLHTHPPFGSMSPCCLPYLAPVHIFTTFLYHIHPVHLDRMNERSHAFVGSISAHTPPNSFSCSVQGRICRGMDTDTLGYEIEGNGIERLHAWTQ